MRRSLAVIAAAALVLGSLVMVGTLVVLAPPAGAQPMSHDFGQPEVGSSLPFGDVFFYPTSATDVARIDLTFPAGTVIDGGLAASSFYVYASNVSWAPASGLVVDGTTLTLTPASAINNTATEAYIEFSLGPGEIVLPTVAGTHQLLIDTYDAGGHLLDSDAAPLTLVHAAAAAYSIVDPVDGTVDASIPVTVQLVDQYGNVVTTGSQAGRDVILVVGGDATGGGFIDIANGVGTRNVTDHTVETVALSLEDHLVLGFPSGFAITSTQSVVFGFGAIADVVVTTQPATSTVAGVAFARQPVLRLDDQFGHHITSGAGATTSITATAAATGALGGTTTRAAVGGVVTFTDLSWDVAGSGRRIGFALGGTTYYTANFTVTHAAPHHLGLTTSPSDTQGADFQLDPSVVQLEDEFDNVVSTGAGATADVVVTKVAGGGALLGTTTVAAVAGVATFDTLEISGTGDAVLRFTQGSLAVDTPTFEVAATMSATLSTMSASSSSLVADDATTATVTVTVRDTNGVPLSGVDFHLDADEQSSDGTTVTPNPAVTTSDGVATFAVRSAVAGVVTYLGSAEGWNGVVTIQAPLTVTFTPVPPPTTTTTTTTPTPPPPTASTTTPTTTPRTTTVTPTPPTTTPPPPAASVPPPLSLPAVPGSSTAVFVEDGQAKQVPLPAGAPPANIAAAAAVSPTESIAVTADGKVFSTNPDDNVGEIPSSVHLNAPVIGLGIHWTRLFGAAALRAAATDGWAPTGYWMLASDGGVFSFGTASFHGSTGARRLQRPVVAMTPTPSGNGYWLVASDGGVFTFGDARFFGSTGARKLNRPVVSLSPTASGKGYALVAEDGGIFTFGDAPFYGSAARTGKEFVGAARTASGKGYWLIADDRTMHPFGDAG